MFRKLIETIRFGLGRGGAVFLILFSLASGVGSLQDQLARIVNNEEATLGDKGECVGALAISPDGQILASSRAERNLPTGNLKLWDLTSKAFRLVDSTPPCYHLEFSADGKSLVFAGIGAFGLVDVATGKITGKCSGRGASTYMTATLSPDGRTLVAGGSGSNDVKLFDVESQKELPALTGHLDIVQSVVFSPDRNTLASASHDGLIKLWDFAARKEIATLKMPGQSHLRTLAFSPDGRTIVSGGLRGDAPIRLWDVANKRLKATLERHRGEIVALLFTHDCRGFVSGSSDGTAVLWDVATERARALFVCGQPALYSMALASDGKSLFAGCLDGTIKRWVMPKGGR